MPSFLPKRTEHSGEFRSFRAHSPPRPPNPGAQTRTPHIDHAHGSAASQCGPQSGMADRYGGLWLMPQIDAGAQACTRRRATSRALSSATTMASIRSGWGPGPEFFKTRGCRLMFSSRARSAIPDFLLFFTNWIPTVRSTCVQQCEYPPLV